MKFFYVLLLVIVTITAAHAQSNTTDSIYEQVDNIADFPGGSNGWTMYLMKNLVYPPAAMTAHVTGSGNTPVCYRSKRKGQPYKSIIRTSNFTG